MKLKTALLGLAMLAGASAFAQTKTDTGLSYNQVGVGYASMTSTISGKDYTFSGLGFGGSVMASENVYMTAAYLSGSGDINGIKLDISQTSIGLGARFKIAKTTDFYGTIAYVDAKQAALGSTYTDTGSSASLGLKTLIAPRVQGNVFAGYSKMTKSDSTSPFGIGADFFIDKNLVAGLSYVTRTDARQFNVTLSYAF